MAGRKRSRSSNRAGMISISAVVLVLLVVLFVQSNTIREKNTMYSAQEENLKAQLEEEKSRTKDIEDMESYMDSKEYVEEVARDKLGLVYKDEILFKSQD